MTTYAPVPARQPPRGLSAGAPRSSSNLSRAHSRPRGMPAAAWGESAATTVAPAKPFEEAKSASPTRSTQHHVDYTTSHSITIDPFAKVNSTRSEVTSPVDTPRGISRPESAPNTRTTPSAYVLPPHLSHLYFPSQSFPPFLLSIASKVFHAKMRDLGVRTAKGESGVEKERRFVWLVCRQSMGASGTGSSSAASLSVASTASTPSATHAAAENGLLALRIPDASLGQQAVREICAFLARDTRFAHLQLSGNILGDEGAHHLAGLLQTNTNLTSLDLRATGLGQTGFAVLLDALVTHPSLTALDLSSLKSEGRMFAGLKGCRSLSKVLRHNTVLRKLHLANAGIVSEGIGSLVKGLQLNRTLVVLDLSANDLTQKSIARLGEALVFLHTLQALLLAENAIGTVGCVLLCETLRKMENLKRLDLRRNGIGLRGFTLLTDTVGEMISLQELLLDGNAFKENVRAGAPGGVVNEMPSSVASATIALNAAASAAHSSNAGAGASDSKDYVDSVLKRLYLTEKRVSPRLLQNSSLRTLSLAATGVSDRLVEELCRVLLQHRTLQTLHLGANGLTDASGYALAELIRTSTTLANLHAYENNLTDAGGLAICQALAAPSAHVTFLSLRVNNVGKAAGTACIHALSLKKSLHVDFSGNAVPWILYSKMCELSARNKRLYESNLSERYQLEYEYLQTRHEYRLSVEDQCLDSIEEMSDLQETLQQLEAGLHTWKEAEAEETKRLLTEAHEWNHQLHETRALETKSEHDLAAAVKELDGRVLALRKAIEKEQRFIASAERLIPQTREEIAAAERELEESLVDVRRDLRLYTTDRNVEYDSLVLLGGDLRKFLRDLEAQAKPPKSPKKGSSAAPSSSPTRPGSRPSGSSGSMATPAAGRRASSKARSPSGSSKKTGSSSSVVTSPSAKTRPISAARRTPSTTRPPSAKLSTSTTSSRPPSAAAAKKSAETEASSGVIEGTRKPRAATAPIVKGKTPLAKKTTDIAQPIAAPEASEAAEDGAL